MSRSLIIVESPAKVKTIQKFLGKNYIVRSSVGHIRDLAKMPTSSKKRTSTKDLSKAEKAKLEKQKFITQLGVNPYDGWEASYEILPGKEKVLDALKAAAEKADDIYLATDIDREGEAIAWHLREAIGGANTRYKRVTFTEITKKAINEAFSNPGTLNIDRVNAQQARRFLDRVVGYMLSPLLWKKIARGLSAGRVQSVALRLIAEREKSVQAFKPVEYWEVRSLLKGKEDPFTVELVKKDDKNYQAKSEKEVEEIKKDLDSQSFSVTKVEKKPSSSKPSAPFITSTLQQAASIRMGYGVKKTMVLAQKLYEAGYITYMRTDSTNLSEEATSVCREYIEKFFGKEYLPEEPNVYKSKKTAQEAHEAIRPTDIKTNLNNFPDKSFEKDALKLYELIWRQFVACQMTAAKYDSTTVLVKSGPYQWKAKGRILIFDGFLKIQQNSKRSTNDDLLLPLIEEGEKLKQLEYKPSQHFTKPPARFTEASLVRELEKKGIGRPSTYAAIISTIQDRGYAKLEKRRFFCLKMGMIVADRLVENFSDLMNFDFTANMEENLDKIANGEASLAEILDLFFKNFSKKVDQAAKTMRDNSPTLTSVKCPECSRLMNIRNARTGTFLSCEGYSLPPKERCKGTLNLISADEFDWASEEENLEEGNAEELRAKKRCPKCDTSMEAFLIDEKRKIHICGNNPECDGHSLETGEFLLKGYEGPVLECDKCASEMQLKSGRFGNYFGCSNEDCKNTRKVLKNGQPAPPKADPIHMQELKCEQSDGYFVLRDGAAGIFLASSAFPKSRETKKPQVADLIRHKEKLDPKYVYLTEAPEQDPEGNATTVRFSRKTKSHFIASDIEGKATGWAVFYKDDKWVEQEAPTKKTSTKKKKKKSKS